MDNLEELDLNNLSDATGGTKSNGSIPIRPPFPPNFHMDKHCLVQYDPPKACGGILLFLEDHGFQGYDILICDKCGQKYKEEFSDAWSYVD